MILTHAWEIQTQLKDHRIDKVAGDRVCAKGASFLYINKNQFGRGGKKEQIVVFTKATDPCEKM